jgi:hypothetical protein
MTQEFNSLVENATWRLVKREKWMDVLTGRWVYKIKEDLQRLITRFKSRWVVRGFEQDDFDETFASTVQMSVVKWLLAFACIDNLHLKQIDFITAFLNSLMKGSMIYVIQPIGFEAKGKEDWVCLLLKALYGLKAAPALWQKTLQTYIFKMGFTPSPAN